jgi:uncharacterized protein (TIGR01777 family)
MLVEKGYEVVQLGRTKKSGKVATYVWDIEKATIDDEVFKNADAVIHLAGAGIADKRWNPKRKLEILESRTKSTALLAHYLERNPQVKTVVAATAIGYYGFGLTDHEFTEVSNPGSDFLAKVVKAWEEEQDKIKGPRLVKLRIGIVLSEKGGALKEMIRPVRWGVGAPLGSGQQFLSWIHIDDLCSMFIKALEDSSMKGAYNATGPYAVTNKEFTKAIANVLHKPLLLPPVPGFVLKLVIGEMADLVLNGSIVSSTKIQKAGFKFKFPTLATALNDLLS